MSALPPRLPPRYSEIMATLHTHYEVVSRGRAHLEMARIAFESDYFPNHIHLAVSHLASAVRCARLAQDKELGESIRSYRDAWDPQIKDHPWMRDIDLVLNESWLSREG